MVTSFVRGKYGWMRARLYRKYVLIVGSLMVGALLVSGGLNIYFTYKDGLNNVSDIEREKAFFAASNIDLFIGGVQKQLELATRVEYEDGVSGIAAREADYMALINRVPAITGVGYWDQMGIEQIRIAQFGRETFTSGSLLPEELLPVERLPVQRILTEAKARGAFNGPVYFDDNSIQHMTIGLSESGSGEGVLVADVNLNFVQLIIAQLSSSDSGLAYVVDSNGFIVSHPVERFVTEHANVSHLPQVKNAITAEIDFDGNFSDAPVSSEKSLEGQSVLAASFPIGNLGWHVIVEQTRSQASTSLSAPTIRGVLILAASLIFAIIASFMLAKKMTSPILKLKDAAESIGLGSIKEIDLQTGDDLEYLGREFNRLSAQIRESRTTFEERVEERTRELAETNADLKAEIMEREKADSVSFLLYRAMEHSPNAVMITDAEGIIEYVNPKFATVTGYTFAEAVGNTPNILKSGRTSRQKYDHLWATLRAGGIWNGELYNKRKDGKFYWSFEIIVPVRDKQGRITHFLAVEQDVTERKKAEEEARTVGQRLAEMNRTLEQRVKERTSELQEANNRLIEAHDQLVRSEKLAAIGQLSAGVAHDLRNPLAAIKNAVYYLNGKMLRGDSSKVNPRIPEFLKIIDDEVYNSNKIISNLLDFARISAPTFSPADLGTLVQDCLGDIMVNEGIYINILDNHHEEQLEVQADGRQLHRVFQNLMLNAQDAMPEGGVITVSTVDTNGSAEVVISDTGEGIKPEHMGKIFDPLFTTKTKGTGLGLAVCQQIVSKHGGTIEVESQLGEGATFRVRLPLAASQGMAREVQNATP